MSQGVPLFWAEYKPITWYVSLYRDTNAGRIWDQFPGSGAAAIGALYAGIPYEGICENEAHKQWLDQILDRAMFAVLADKKKEKGAKKEDQEVAASILSFFNSIVVEANQFLKPSGGDAKKKDSEDEGMSDDDAEEADHASQEG